MAKPAEYTIPAAAELIGVSKQYLYRLIAAGKIKLLDVYKRDLRIAETDVQKLRRLHEERQARRAGAQ